MTKVKYWAGFINSENMSNPGWFQNWRNKALEAEKENCQLVVFKIPNQQGKKGAMASVITMIENGLQITFDK